VAAALCAAVALDSPLRADSGRVLTGELVVLKGTGHRFRIVEQPGSFTAPAGTPLESLDGHTVRVELSSNGRVMSITETPVAIDPVTHGWSTVRGELVVTDQFNRRFTVAGDNQVYVAPPNIDIAPYNGKLVEFKLDEQGRVAELRLVGSAPPSSSSMGEPPYAARGVPAMSPSCTYGGEVYSAGAAICQSGTQYRCDGSQWHSLGSACGTEARESNRPSAAPRSCAVGGATVASGSGICRDGTTFRCDDGAWINIQTACR
jgi:hypothetical protein